MEGTSSSSSAGGFTPVVQTCDTDLNQTVKRAYISMETEKFIDQMVAGVPSCNPERCIETVGDLLMNMKLHLDAAEGCLKAGLAVSLHGSEDHKIVREAGALWHELGMRNKTNVAVAAVRGEYGVSGVG